MSFQDLEAGRRVAVGQSQRQSWYARERQLQQLEPSQAVAAGIFQINTAVASFNRLVNSLGTHKDTFELRDKLRKTRQHIGQLVKDTSAKLKQASETDQHTEVSAAKKIGDAKLAKDFQTVLKEFQKAQRLAAERETTYAPFVPKEVHSSSYTDHELEIRSSGSLESRQQQALLLESKRQDVLHLDNEIVFNEAIIEEREQGIQEIQHQISEVNEIFKDLAVLVHDQGIMIDDISSNVESSHASTTQATSQLKKAAKSQKTGSSLMCLLLVIFGIILIIVVIVLLA